jgi:hypothetical protein
MPRTRVPRRQVTLPRRATWLLFAIVAALAFAVLAFALASGEDGGEQPPETPAVEPVPQSDDSAEQARNLAEWLRDNAR